MIIFFLPVERRHLNLVVRDVKNSGVISFVLRAKLYISTTMQFSFTASVRAQYFLLIGSCSVCEIVQDDLECTSVMEVDDLKTMFNVTCQNPDPDLFAVIDCLPALDL